MSSAATHCLLQKIHEKIQLTSPLTINVFLMKNYIDDNNIASIYICLPLRRRFNDGKVTVIKSKFKSELRVMVRMT